MNKYNKKIDYLFCKYGPHQILLDIDELHFKQVYNEIIEPTNPYEGRVLKFKQILKFIKDENNLFNYENIIKILAILKEDSKIKKPELLIKLINEEKLANYSLKIFIKTIEEKIFDEDINIEMAKIIHNFIEIKKCNIPIVFYYFETEQMVKLINNGEQDKSNIYLLYLYNKTFEFNEPHEFFSKAEMINKILSIKNHLISKFYVTNFYIFGSFVKNEQTEYSDLDVYVEIQNDRMNDINLKYYLIEYLENKLGVKVDGIVKDIEFNKSFLAIDILRNLEKIF